VGFADAIGHEAEGAFCCHVPNVDFPAKNQEAYRTNRAIWLRPRTGIDLPKLAEELERLRNAMKGESTGTPEHDEAIGAVAGAEKAAAKNDGLAALRYLKSAGTWALGENRRRTPYAA
jgi:hypothetical protein